ncbi:MAG: hypothetical protein JWO30_4742 [Fibrobacteres bacterium]|nr:hypothetical protein [Fibrobacterota bacterium]
MGLRCLDGIFAPSPPSSHHWAVGALSLIALIGAQPIRAEIILKLRDSQSNPIQGVTCAQYGGVPAVSDATGTLTLQAVSGISRLPPRLNPNGRIPLSRIPLSAGEKATLTVADMDGRIVLRREVSLGDRIRFPGKDRGVYFAVILGRNFSTQGRFVNLGGGLVFEGVTSPASSAKAAAKSDATREARDAFIVCGKSGYPAQAYRVPDGTTATLDFSKPSIAPLYDGTTPLQPDFTEVAPPIPAEGWLGGHATLPYRDSVKAADRFSQMTPNIAPGNGQAFLAGERVQRINFTTGGVDGDSVAPILKDMAGKTGDNFVNTSCIACHANNGRALAPFFGGPLYVFVAKVGDANGNPDPRFGKVLQPQKTSGFAEGHIEITRWTESGGLRRPQFDFLGGPEPVRFSVRISPQLVGMGLLEAIPESAIQALADPDDADGDGVSGRVQIVADLESGVPRVGRFGWKAGKESVSHQVAGALNTDMGVMTSILPSPDCGSEQTGCGNPGSEISDADFKNLVDYIGLLGIIARRDLQDPQALRGESLFTSTGCAACHMPTFTTSAYHPKAELRNQTIHPYTDLLLHDLGPGLADNLSEEGASGSEWRTAPLWNIGLTAEVSGEEGYLHDGRARTLQEAILWHAGEATKAATAFKSLSPTDAAALIKFLKSL